MNRIGINTLTAHTLESGFAERIQEQIEMRKLSNK